MRIYRANFADESMKLPVLSAVNEVVQFPQCPLQQMLLLMIFLDGHPNWVKIKESTAHRRDDIRRHAREILGLRDNEVLAADGKKQTVPWPS